jgi:hypothetical protein
VQGRSPGSGSLRPRRGPPITRREWLRAALRAGLAALAFLLWPFARAHAREPVPAGAEARIAAQRSRLERGLGPEALASCRRAAGRIAPELAGILGSAEGERALLARIGHELEAEGIAVGAVPVLGQIVAAILAVIAAVLILIGEVLAKAKEDQAARKKEDADGHETASALRDLTLRAVERLEKCRDEDAFPPRKRP